MDNSPAHHGQSFASILYPGSPEPAPTFSQEAPSCFRDLCLDQIVEAAIAGHVGTGLSPFYTPLRDLDAIAYRQEVMRDLEDGRLMEAIRAFGQRMHAMREQLVGIDKVYCKPEKERWFLEAVVIYCDAVGRLAQAMMQSGMYVAASDFAGDVCTGLFTHYRREEDPAMRGGRLDEELQRLSAMTNELTSGAVILFNESFASTNEREGSEIATQTASALRDRGIRVFFVTHLHGFAHGFFAEAAEGVACLRAERLADGRRTFRIIVGVPLETSHGEDIYREVFGDFVAATDCAH